MPRTVVIGLLGTTLDYSRDVEGRWGRWRPTLSICQQETLVVDRLELLCDPRHRAMAQQLATDIGSASPETEVRIHELAVADWWELEEVYGALHDFARRYPFEPEEEEYLIHITTGTHVAQICLFLLTEARYLPGRLLQSSPPGRREHLPVEPGRLRIFDLDLSRYDRLASRFQQEQREATTHLKSGIATANRVFNRMIERIETVAMRSREPILLMGPTGAGKSHLARRVYEVKQGRRLLEGRFVEVNCATLRGDGAMSTLFGHVKGAFTGAQRDRPGLLRAADGGLLFLDEIGELGLDEQTMLLRALEERRFLPLGEDQEVGSDFQLIAGTNRDLATEVAAGRFRADLFARINCWSFTLPGLAERREDIEPNLDYELERFASRHGSRVTFSREARSAYLAFARSLDCPWRGNFRDLNASVTRMATLAPGGRITTAEVAEEIDRLRQLWAATPPHGVEDDPLAGLALGELDLFDRVQLAEVVRVCRSSPSLSAAGRRLFAVSREGRSSVNDADRLRKYLARFGLEWATVRPSSLV